MNSNNENELLDKVINSIRSEEIDSASVSAAADRVWARISAANTVSDVNAPAGERIEN